MLEKVVVPTFRQTRKPVEIIGTGKHLESLVISHLKATLTPFLGNREERLYDRQILNQRTSTRRNYGTAFQGIDALIEDKAKCGLQVTSAAGGPLSATWASAYSTWMIDKIASQNGEISKTAS